MSNPHLEMMKQNRALQKGAKQDYQGITTLGNLAQKSYALQAGAPDPRQNTAEMLDRSAQEVTGGRPAKGWRALVSGMLEGAATGLKGKVSEEKKEQAEKIGRVFEWLEANTMAMAQRNQQILEKRQAQEELEPLLKDYAQNMGNMAPLAREKYAEHILNRYNEMTGSDYELVSIDQVNPLKITVKSPKNGNALFVHDFSQQVGGVDADLYQKAIEYDERRFQQEEERLRIARDNAAAYQSDINSRWNPQQQFSVGVGKEGAKNFAQSVKKAEDENYTLEDALYATKEAKQLIATGKVNAGDTAMSWLKSLTGKAFNTEGMTITQVYDAVVAELYDFAKGNLSANPKDIEFLTKKVPDSSKTPQALALMIDRTERIIKRKIARNDALIKQMPDYIGGMQQGGMANGRQAPQGQQQASPQQGMQGQPQQVAPQQASSPTPDQNTVRVISPEGIPGVMSKDAFNKVLQQGLGFKLA